MLSTDAVVFDNVAASAIRDAGLLNGVSPITATAGGGLTALVGDVGKLADALADAGLGNSEEIVFFCGVPAAVRLKALVGPRFDYKIIGTPALADTTIVGVIPSAIAFGFDGGPTIETARDATLHLEDTSPAQIGTPPNVVAAPVRSLYQTDTIAIRVRQKITWRNIVPGAVQVINSITW